MLIESSNAAIFSFTTFRPSSLFKTNQAHKSGIISVVIILTLLKMKIPKVRHC